MAHKQAFLVVYDYGQGGIWAFIDARSRRDIERRFRDLKVMEEPPVWMSDEELAEIEQTMTFDADRPQGWLAKLATAAGKGAGKDAAAG